MKGCFTIIVFFYISLFHPFTILLLSQQVFTILLSVFFLFLLLLLLFLINITKIEVDLCTKGIVFCCCLVLCCFFFALYIVSITRCVCVDWLRDDVRKILVYKTAVSPFIFHFNTKYVSKLKSKKKKKTHTRTACNHKHFH